MVYVYGVYVLCGAYVVGGDVVGESCLCGVVCGVFGICVCDMCINLQLVFSLVENPNVFGYFYDFYVHYIICLCHQSIIQ